jgi:hypothetical protein
MSIFSEHIQTGRQGALLRIVLPWVCNGGSDFCTLRTSAFLFTRIPGLTYTANSTWS